jgi:uncharacterized protein YeeX (DUF496 family)
MIETAVGYSWTNPNKLKIRKRNKFMHRERGDKQKKVKQLQKGIRLNQNNLCTGVHMENVYAYTNTNMP